MGPGAASWRAQAACVAAGLALTAGFLLTGAPAEAAEDSASAAANRAFRQASRSFGPDSDQAFSAHNTLIRALIAENRRAEALRRLADMRAAILARSGPDAPIALAATYALAIFLADQGQTGAAETMARDLLARSRRVMGETHTTTLRASVALGDVLARRGRYAEAYGPVKAGYEGLVAALGPDAYEVRRIGALLLTITSALQYDNETLVLEQSLARPPAAGAPLETRLLAASHELRLLRRQGRFAEAVAVGEPLAAQLENHHGAHHIATLNAMHDLAAAYAALGRAGPAADMSRRVYEGYQRALGPDHPETLAVGEGVALRRMLDRDGAVRADGRALLASIVERRRRVQGPYVADVVGAEVNLAYGAMGDDASAAAQWLMRAMQDLAEGQTPADSPQAIALDTLTGEVLMGLGDGRIAYRRLSDAAAHIRKRSLDRRIAASSGDAVSVLVRHRAVFLSQVRAGWMYAHEP